MLFFYSLTVAGQTTPSIKEIPTDVKQNASSKAVTKSNQVSNDALNKLDTASNKIFKGIKGMFKKKNKSQNKNTNQDSTKTQTPGSTSPSSSIGTKYLNYFVLQTQNQFDNEFVFKFSLYNKSEEYL